MFQYIAFFVCGLYPKKKKKRNEMSKSKAREKVISLTRCVFFSLAPFNCSFYESLERSIEKNADFLYLQLTSVS